MADTIEKKILISLELKNDQLQAGLEKSTQTVEQLKNKQSELRAEIKKLEAANQTGSASWNKLRDELQSVTTSLQAAKKEQSGYQLQATKTVEANTAEEGSLKQKRAALSAANQEYARASAEAKKTDEATIKLGQDIRTLTDELKAEEAALGNTFRNVGNYPQTIDGLNQKLADMRDAIKSAAIGSTEFEKIRDEIGKVETQLLVANGKFDEFGQKIAKNKTKETLNDIKDSATGAVSAFQLMNLVQDEGEDKIKAIETATRAMAIMQAVQNTLIGAEAAIGLAVNTVKSARIALMATEIATTQGLTVATFAQAAAQAVLNAVMKANPIMVVLGLVLGLTAALYKLFGGTDEATESQRKYNKELENQGAALEKSIEKTKAAQERQIALMQAEKKTELDINKQRIQDLQTNNDKRAELIKSTQQRNMLLIRMAAQEEDEEKKKALKEEQKQVSEHLDKLYEENKQYWNDKRILEIEQQNIIAENKKRSDELAISSIRNAKQRETAELRLQMEEELKQVGLSEQDKINIREKYAIMLGEKQKQWAKEAFDKGRQRLDEENQLLVAKTAQGSDARFSAQRVSIEKLRDYDLKAVGITETQKQLIRLKADEDIKALNQEQANRQRQLTQEQVELENTKTRAINQLELLKATTAEEVLAAKLEIVHDEMTMSLEALQAKANEEKRIAQESIADADQRKAALIAIEEARAAEEMLILQKSAEAIEAETTAYKLKQIDQRIADDQIQLELAEGNAQEQLRIQQEMLDLRYQKEIQAANAAGKDTTLITAKWEKDKQKLQDATLNNQLDAVKNTLGQAAGMFAKHTAAYKILSAAQATIDTYQAANAAFASGSKVSPAFGIIAASVAVAAGLANVAKIMSVSTPEQKYEGGYTGDGDARAESTALGRKPYIYHKREYVAPAWLVEHPVGSRLVASLEQMRISRGQTNNRLRGFYDGGFTDSQSIDRIGASVMDTYTLQNTILSAVSTLPNPVVYVEDINSGQSTVTRVSSRANI